jgi:hypothetical protein
VLQSSYLYLLHRWDDRHGLRCLVCLLSWGFVNVCVDWPGTEILLMSASRGAGIISMSHSNQPIFSFLK